MIRHGSSGGASPWVVRFAPRIRSGGAVLDVACGSGRHTRLLLARGHHVTAIDRDITGLADLADDPRLERLAVDLESVELPPFAGRRFAGVVVTNYLHRPLLSSLVEAVEPGGILLYETFADGNQRYGRPSNPAFLLRPGELIDAVRGHLRVLAYEDLVLRRPRPAAVQRIAAHRAIESPPPAAPQPPPG